MTAEGGRGSGGRAGFVARHTGTLAFGAVIAAVVLALIAGYQIGSVNDVSVDDRGAALERQGREAVGGGTTGDSSAAEQPAGTAASQFWSLTDETRQEAGDNTERQSELLEERLRKLPAPAIASYERFRHRIDERLYSWDVWGAAYVIEDGCSDDCFRDFRAYLISLGRGAVQTALSDPDALAPIVQDAEQGDWENADNVAPEAYEEVAGTDIPGGDEDLSGTPSGEEWDSDNQEALIQRFSQLAAKFR